MRFHFHGLISDLIANDLVLKYQEKFKESLKVYYIFTQDTTIQPMKNASKVYAGRFTKDMLKACLPLFHKSVAEADHMTVQKDAIIKSGLLKPEGAAKLDGSMSGSTTIVDKPSDGNQPRDISENALRIFVSGKTDFNDFVSTSLQDIGYLSQQVVVFENSQTMYRALSNLSADSKSVRSNLSKKSLAKHDL